MFVLVALVACTAPEPEPVVTAARETLALSMNFQIIAGGSVGLGALELDFDDGHREDVLFLHVAVCGPGVELTLSWQSGDPDPLTLPQGPVHRDDFFFHTGAGEMGSLAFLFGGRFEQVTTAAGVPFQESQFTLGISAAYGLERAWRIPVWTTRTEAP